MFIPGFIGLKNYTKFSCGIASIETKIKVLIERFALLGLNRRYSVLLGLTDNLFDIILENTTLIQDSIVGQAYETSLREKTNKFVSHFLLYSLCTTPLLSVSISN